MEDKQKKSESNYVLRDLKTSAYAKKKFTVKKNKGRPSPNVGNTDIRDGKLSENAAEKGRGKKSTAQKSQLTAGKEHSREKRAEYIKESLQNDIAASYSEQFDAPVSPKEELRESYTEKSETKPVGKVKEDSDVPKKKDVSEYAGRMKKAAYIKKKLQIDIIAAALYNVSENLDTPSDVQSPVGTETKGENGESHTEKSGSIYPGMAENDREQWENDVKHEYKNKILAAEMKRRRETAAMSSRALPNEISAEKANASDMKSDGTLPALDMAGEYISAVQKGDAAGMVVKPAVSVIKNNMGSIGGITDDAATISGAVENSDSTGGAVVNAGMGIAAKKVKAALSCLAERQKKKYRYIDRNTGSAEQSETKNTDVQKEQRKTERGKEEYIKEQEKQQKEYQRRQQKNVYMKHNRNNPAFVGNEVQKKAKGESGKSMLMLLLCSGSSFMMILLIVVLVLVLIASTFSWLTPFKFKVAGDSTDEEKSAESTAEIIDGYVVMMQNYMDVIQARYYLDYGDWYGGAYVYPSANISFADFFAEKSKVIVDRITARYKDALAGASSQEEAQSIANSMSAEISSALADAAEEAAEEYEQLIKALNDSMCAGIRRQHYEVYSDGGANDVYDSAEFSGKPIVGTNKLSNVEINSSLSAEELVAMAALYKSLMMIDGSEDDTNAVYNITPQDMMDCIEKTEYIQNTLTVTHNKKCSGNCKRRLTDDYESGYEWEYYCDNDHDNLSGSVGVCKSKAEMIRKIMEITNAADNGFDNAKCNTLYDEYIAAINKELGISASDYRKFGSADNSRAKDFYAMLMTPSGIPNNFWSVDTHLGGEESDDE